MVIPYLEAAVSWVCQPAHIIRALTITNIGVGRINNDSVQYFAVLVTIVTIFVFQAYQHDIQTSPTMEYFTTSMLPDYKHAQWVYTIIESIYYTAIIICSSGSSYKTSPMFSLNTVQTRPQVRVIWKPPDLKKCRFHVIIWQRIRPKWNLIKL